MFVNLTPHPIVVFAEDGSVLADIPASGTVARLAETVTEVGVIGNFPLTVVALGDIEGLPEDTADLLATYVVSMPLAMRAAAVGRYRHRGDIVYPFGQVRDAAGRIIGCRSLARIA
jgi:hypothetical protein